MSAKIKRLFIANRGEIARRIALSAERLGIETVAIADRNTPPNYLAGLVSEFVKLSEAERSGIFLNREGLIKIAKEYHCDAVHPGFGFLSEDAGFAKAVSEAGLVWVGPSHQAIAQMGSKAEASNIAEAAGVPCLPALRGIDPSLEADLKKLDEFVDKIGLPVLIKASMGGGGKGMRLVEDRSQLHQDALRAKSEASSSFGSGSLIVEPYLGTPRHVEVQVLGDAHGNIKIVGDRDCSLQRRHQKIVEEAPAPMLTESTRKAMHQAAYDLAKGVDYVSAGTVEFLVDWAENKRNLSEQPFYFLEMNTRLQVEHPVSEEVHGTDLVAWQLKIAMGESLAAADIETSKGHSIEVRLYAEDPWQDYLPATGPVHCFAPHHEPGVRWEVGIDAVDAISPNFDPMFAKLVVKSDSRKMAIILLERALSKSTFVGPLTNIELLWWIAAESKFREAPLDTGYLKRELATAKIAMQSRRAEVIERHGERLAKSQITSAGDTDFSLEGTVTKAFHEQAPPASPIAGDEQLLSLGTYAAENADRRSRWQSFFSPKKPKDFPLILGSTNGRGYSLKWLKAGIIVLIDDRSQSTGLSSRSAQGSDGSTESPVPGKVVALKAKDGDAVAAGATIVILESMKMEFEVKAPKDGTIAKILVAEGEQVEAGAVMIEWVQEES